MPPMTKSDLDTPYTDYASLTDEQRWKRLFDNIRKIALKKSDAMINAYFADEEDFDRDARILRTLMGAAEIAGRMRRHDEKERDLNDERPEPRAYTDEEIRDIYRKVAGYADSVERAARTGRRNAGANQPGDRENARTRGAQSLVDRRS